MLEASNMTKYNATPRIRELTGSRKCKFFLSTILPGNPVSHNSYWDGGSRSYYSIHNISTGQSIQPNCNPGFPALASRTSVLKDSEILVETGVFCGKPSTPSITCNEPDLDKVLRYLGNPQIAKEQ